MNNRHPITPPPELVRQWLTEAADLQRLTPSNLIPQVAAFAAQWGADQELEACCEWLTCGGLLPRLPALTESLRAARRPKPPNLKEQALAALDDAVMRGDCITISDALPTLRRALEALND